MTSGSDKASGSGWDIARIRRALRSVIDPESGKAILAEDGVVDVRMPGDGIALVELSPDAVPQSDRDAVRARVAKAVQGLGGIQKVEVRYTGEQAAPPLELHASAPSGAKPQAKPAQEPRPTRPQGVRRIIAVSSAKGGVGKSTVTLNLARAFARLGHRTGILDADVYGPSVPTMTGLIGTTAGFTEKDWIAPIEVDGVKTMSMGFIIPEGKAVPWRGPMVMNALIQLLSGVDWGELDDLFIDMPPGTGDVALTLVQQASIDGAIIVSTPQEVALADVRRGVEFFQRTQVPILGVIENMSFLKDAASGAEIDLFGRGGAQAEARKLGVPFLGEVPFDISLRESSDTGRPAQEAIGQVFLALAEDLQGAMSMIPTGAAGK